MAARDIFSNLGRMLASGKWPQRRALAALAKVHGRRLERRWPFLPRAQGEGLNFQFDDALALQYARSARMRMICVGAYDGLENDPVSAFALTHDCDVAFVEPQPLAFERLMANLGTREGFQFHNAAIDAASGTREFFTVDPARANLPEWTRQLASFSRDHIIRHADRAPGIEACIVPIVVPTLSFEELLQRCGFKDGLNVLQLDAEGFDAQLVAWFPFERVLPGVVQYEIAHMTPGELARTRNRLSQCGYKLFATLAGTDEMAILP